MGTNNSTLTLSKNYFAATGNRKPFHSGIFQCNPSTCVTLANFFFFSIHHGTDFFGTP